MKNKIAACVLATLVSSAVLAEAPVFRDQVLTVDGVTVITAQGPVLYGNVKLQQQQDGNFRLLQAEKSPLALIHSVDVRIAKSLPPQVSVQIVGVQTNACVALKDPAVTRTGSEFSVILAETTQAPGSVCMSLVAVTPFQLDVKLDITDLPHGSYSVNVNGTKASFEL